MLARIQMVVLCRARTCAPTGCNLIGCAAHGFGAGGNTVLKTLYYEQILLFLEKKRLCCWPILLSRVAIPVTEDSHTSLVAQKKLWKKTVYSDCVPCQSSWTQAATLLVGEDRVVACYPSCIRSHVSVRPLQDSSLLLDAPHCLLNV